MNLRGHDLYLTIGLNLGEPNFPLPRNSPGEDALAHRDVRMGDGRVAGISLHDGRNWRDYSWVEWRGTWYAQKAEAFKAVIDVPAGSRCRLRCAYRFLENRSLALAYPTPIRSCLSFATTAGSSYHPVSEAVMLTRIVAIFGAPAVSTVPFGPSAGEIPSL
jgi:hypothetical protein